MNESAYQALRQHAACIDLTGRGHIRATGEDRCRLLHAMTTNNVEALMPGTGCHTFFLTAQGRILADANIFCMPDYLLIDTEPQVKQRVLDHLDKFIIADDVTLEDFPDAAVIAVEGPEAEAALTRVGAPCAQSEYSITEWGHTLLVVRTSWTGGPGYWFFLPAKDKADLIHHLSLPEADMETANAVRIEHGKPLFGVDFSEKNIPQETQLMSAVSFSKGCYLGQEIVERVRSRGQVKQLLASLEIEAPDVVAGSKVMSQDKEVGEITSAARGSAFALVRAEALSSPLTVNGATARVRPASL